MFEMSVIIFSLAIYDLIHGVKTVRRIINYMKVKKQDTGSIMIPYGFISQMLGNILLIVFIIMYWRGN
jgi:hypothetical protein